VALDSSDRLYSLGYTLHRLEDDRTWTNIPLWTENPISVNSFRIAPSGDIWVEHGYGLPHEDGLDFMIYSDSAWSTFTSPYPIYAYPHWDADGNLWAWTAQGLCKLESGNWHCYDRSNSPLIPHRVMEYKIDKYNNIWITLKSGGLLLFNEDQIRDIDIEPVGVVESQRQLPELRLYPNPAREYFIVSSGDLNPESRYDLTLLDLLGRTVFATQGHGDKLRVDIPDYIASGLYVVRVSDRAGAIVGARRLIVE
jgi:hypothetical protein